MENQNNEWINWFEKAIKNEHIKHYEYNQFKDIREIGSGELGKVYQANLENTILVLKEFQYENIKEITYEVKKN